MTVTTTDQSGNTTTVLPSAGGPNATPVPARQPAYRLVPRDRDAPPDPIICSKVTIGANPMALREPEKHEPRPPQAPDVLASAKKLGLSAELAMEGRGWHSTADSPLSADQLERLDAQHELETTAELQRMWGPQYEAKLAAARAYAASLPDGGAQKLNQARDSSGRRLGNNARAIVEYAAAGERHARLGLVLEGNTQSQIAAIETFMRSNPTNRRAYMHDSHLQARYAELLRAREKAK